MITTQKLSISLPSHLYTYLASSVSSREISRYITDAVESKILAEKVSNYTKSFLLMRNKLPKFKNKDILLAIHKGRK